MTREGLDGINTDASLMDHSIPIVAYYIDGPRAWSVAEISLFPNSVHVQIAVNPDTRAGHVIDRENGDATPAHAASWAHQRRVDGFAFPIVYTSLDGQADVIAAFREINEPLPGWWLAHWDDVDQLPAGALGKQYASTPNWDRTIWADLIPGVDTASMPPSNGAGPAPAGGKLAAGTVLQAGAHGSEVALLQATLNREYPLYSHLAVDGIYGPLTEGVVREFQERDHIEVDGIAGPQTLGRLGLIA